MKIYNNNNNNINNENNNLINNNFLKQVHRKKNASNCTFRPLLMVIINSKYANK